LGLDLAGERLEAVPSLADAHLGDRSQEETITRDELGQRPQRGNLVLTDRP